METGQLTLLGFVAAGGAFGSVCRYVMINALNNILGKGFPYATFAVNVLGSLLMGMLIAFIVGMLPRGRELYILLGVGALGGFTTFSAFSYDAYMLLEKGLAFQAFLYIAGSIALSISAFFLGMVIFKLVVT